MERMAHDAGVSVNEFRELATHSTDSADLMLERMTALDLDPNEVVKVEPQVFRDMQRVCSMCKTQKQCVADLERHVLLHDGSPVADESCPDWAMWLAARGVRGFDASRGPRFNQSSLVIEAAAAGRGVALAKRALAQDDLDAGRLVAPLTISTSVDFAYYVVFPKTKGRLPQVKSFVTWLSAEAAAHEAAMEALNHGAGI